MHIMILILVLFHSHTIQVKFNHILFSGSISKDGDENLAAEEHRTEYDNHLDHHDHHPLHHWNHLISY